MHLIRSIVTLNLLQFYCMFEGAKTRAVLSCWGSWLNGIYSGYNGMYSDQNSMYWDQNSMYSDFTAFALH